MRAMVLRGDALAIEDVERPTPGPGQVLAKVLACGICGSDLHAALYLGEMIAASRASGSSAWDTIDREQAMVMGHEFVAEVVEVGEGAENWRPGQRVTSMPVLPDRDAPNGFRSIGYAPEVPGAYGEYVLMGATMLLPVEDSLPDEVAATTEPCAVGLHAVRQAGLTSRDHVVVMGAGPIGLMTLLWLKEEGVKHVTVSDYAASRRGLAARLGADLVVNPGETGVQEAHEAVMGSRPTVVFECVGIRGTLEQAMEMTERQGTVVVVGVCMLEDTIRPMVGINKQLTLRFVLGYTADEYAEALAALTAGRVDTRPLITRIVSLEELPAAFKALASPEECKVVVKPNG